MTFDVSGVTASPILLFLFMYVVALLASTGGLSGAFLLLPFQISVLGFTSPAVTPTNHLFNVIAIPSGVYRYWKEGRMVWPLATIITIGTVPGVVAGSFARIYYLKDPGSFRFFAGLVLLLIGSRLISKIMKSKKAAVSQENTPESLRVKVRRFDWLRLEYEFQHETYGVSIPILLAFSAVIGMIGGAYGVGGGAIIGPFLITFFRLPVHTTAGATLFGTLLTSLVAVLFFAFANPLFGIPDVSPDWKLGAIFGFGGLLGMYTGASLQKRIPSRWIEILLAIMVTGIALKYIFGYVWG